MTAVSLSVVTENFQSAALRGASEGSAAFMEIYNLVKDQAVGEISKSEAFRRASSYANAEDQTHSASLRIARLELGLE